jgi:hypothetical protein
MSTILEQIIRQNLAKADGAVMAYAVKVKGASDPEEIKQLVIGATMASTRAESESSEPVGGGSKYGRSYNQTTNSGNYRYVMSQPISKKNQLIYVWIIPNKIDEYHTLRFQKQDKKDDSIINVGTYSPDKVGNAQLVVVNEYNLAVEEYNNKVAKQSNLPQLTTLKNLNSIKSQELPNEPEKDASSSTTDSEQDTEQDTSDNILKSKEQPFVYFPDGYTAKTKQGEKFKVYTLNDEDKYVYIIIDNLYQKALKSDFEEKWVNGIEVSNEPVTDADTIEKLNKITKQNIPVTTPVTPEKETTPADTKKETPPEEKKKDKEKEEKKKEIKPEEIKFVKDKKYILKPTNVYVYENKNFKKVGAVSDNTAATYISTASDKEYIKIKLKEGEFYVKKSAVKY